jgi:hypothetical protein
MQPLDEGTWSPTKRSLVPSSYSVKWRLSGGCEAPGLGYSLESFYQDMFNLCQSYYGIYACIPGQATTPDSDGRILTLECMLSGAHGIL